VAGIGLDRQRPVALDAHAVPVADQPVRGGNALHALPDGPGRGDVLEREVVGERPLVDGAWHRGIDQKRLELRGEDDALAVVVVVERLLAYPIAREQQPALLPIVEREREHAAQVIEHAIAVLLVEVEQHLRVARAAEAMAARGERALDRGPVVELAVGSHPHRLVLVRHRLMAARRQVDDREPALRERHAALVPQSVIVGTAMPQDAGLARDQGRIGETPAAIVEDPIDAAHRQLPPAAPRLVRDTRSVLTGASALYSSSKSSR
jgi:hypothetical protein